MGKGSHQSKQKQQTSKNESSTVKTDLRLEPENEGQKVVLSTEQAALFKQLLAAMAEAQNNLNFAMLAANIDGDSIVGGNLDGENPYFVTHK